MSNLMRNLVQNLTFTKNLLSISSLASGMRCNSDTPNSRPIDIELTGL